jgi:serine/threonine-protein phosphatase 6 regulatory subunit 3
MAAQFTKINAIFMTKKPEEVCTLPRLLHVMISHSIVTSQMIAFIKSQPNVVERLLAHIETPAIVDLILRVLQVEDQPGGAGVIDVRRDGS